MFCPKCATQNVDGAHFCRTCGANISLVPQALTGQLAPAPQDEDVPDWRRHRRRRREVTLDSAFKSFFIGVAFLFISIALSRSIGATWWFWMLIPAFSLMASGIGQYIRLKEQKIQPEIPAPQIPPTLPRHTADELRPPVPSVTEGTTRHLGVEAPTRHLETHDRK